MKDKKKFIVAEGIEEAKKKLKETIDQVPEGSRKVIQSYIDTIEERHIVKEALGKLIVGLSERNPEFRNTALCSLLSMVFTVSTNTLDNQIMSLFNTDEGFEILKCLDEVTEMEKEVLQDLEKKDLVKEDKFVNLGNLKKDSFNFSSN